VTITNSPIIAIFKASYNVSGDAGVRGGICGTGFFVDSKTVLTTYHNFSRDKFKPSLGYSHCQFWLIPQNDTIPIEKVYISDYPEFDTVVIKLPEGQGISRVLKLSNTNPIKGERCFNVGYFSSEGIYPELNVTLDRSSNGLSITKIDLCNQVIRGEGIVETVFIETKNYNDVKLKGKEVIKLSYGGRKGMSGGPLIRAATGEVIGIMSYGLPQNAVEKDHVFAVSVRELKKLLESVC